MASVPRQGSDDRPRVLPYGMLVGQAEIRAALELAYVNRAIGGVLISGPRGTAKSTAVRAFAVMVSGNLPVTLPLGATDDRVLGGWDIESLLMDQKAGKMEGLLRKAADSESGILYVDEVNLLDDHLVDIMLDSAASGILNVEREGLTDSRDDVDFTLIGTMNPDEGGLRPQLLDRFGLVATTEQQVTESHRAAIIEAAMDFDHARRVPDTKWWRYKWAADDEDKARLYEARNFLPNVGHKEVIPDCAKLATRLDVVGSRGPVALLQAGRAQAALAGDRIVTPRHLAAVAKLALVHRRAKQQSDGVLRWTAEDEQAVIDVLGD